MEEDSKADVTVVIRPKGWGARHTLALMAFLGFTCETMLRNFLTVTIVAMVNTESARGNLTTDFGNSSECPDDGLAKEENEANSGGLDWSPKVQGAILGSLYWGYLVTQIPGGLIADRLGGKQTFGGGILAASLVTLLAPWAAKTHYYLLMAARVLQGLAIGGLHPANVRLCLEWLPVQERARGMAVIMAGLSSGMVLALPLSGFIAEELGWEAVFYIMGSMGVGWFLMWTVLCHNSPKNHPRISKEERAYILNNRKAENGGTRNLWVPFSQIMTSAPFVSLALAHVGLGYGSYTVVAGMPTYLANIQNYSLKHNGLLSATPHAIGWICAYPIGIGSDRLTNSGLVSKTVSRKIFNSIGMYGIALGLVWLAFAGCSKIMTMVAFCVCICAKQAVIGGLLLNHQDLSPNYAGTLFGITNSLAQLFGGLGPYVFGQITNENQTQSSWRIVFLLASGIVTFCNTVFVFFGSAEIQTWNKSKDSKDNGPSCPEQSNGGDAVSDLPPTTT